MSIKATKIKSAVLKPAKKIGVVVVENSRADKALGDSAALAAKVYNKGEVQVKKAKAAATGALAKLKAKIHEATAPEAAPAAPAKKPARKPAAKVVKK